VDTGTTGCSSTTPRPGSGLDEPHGLDGSDTGLVLYYLKILASAKVRWGIADQHHA
jgi:hypothetical protein